MTRLINLGLLGLILVVAWIAPVDWASAQEEQPSNPVYIVQEGDTLWGIAQRFGIPWEDLARENDISDPGQLVAGVELVIPGLQGVDGVLTTESIPFGESLRSLTRRYQVPVESLILLNHITSPGELYIGGNIIVPQSSLNAGPGERVSIARGE